MHEHATHNHTKQCLEKSTLSEKISLSLTKQNPSSEDRRINHFSNSGIIGEGYPSLQSDVRSPTC